MQSACTWPGESGHAFCNVITIFDEEVENVGKNSFGGEKRRTDLHQKKRAHLGAHLHV